jgi:hypothetical protein
MERESVSFERLSKGGRALLAVMGTTLTVRPLPVFPYEETSAASAGISQRCQKRKSSGRAKPMNEYSVPRLTRWSHSQIRVLFWEMMRMHSLQRLKVSTSHTLVSHRRSALI